MTHEVWRSYDELEQVFRSHIAATLGEWVAPDSPHYAATLTFALGRLDEGRQLASYFSQKGFVGRVLDIGAGNGGVSLGMANNRKFSVACLDLVINPDLLELRREIGVPMQQVLGTGHSIPFGDETFDLVLCLETIEHVPRPDLLATQIMRVLRPGGLCMITTPPRLRYWFRRDPHFDIPALILLPDSLQRFVATRVLHRTNRYDVIHIFWHVREIARLFAGGEVEVLWNHAYPGPVNWRERLWFRFRHFLWDRIIIRKS